MIIAKNMNRPVRLYPGSDPNVFLCAPWLGDIYNTTNSGEMWIDYHLFNRIETPTGAKTKQSPNFDLINQADRLVVFDFYHGEASVENWEIDWIKELAAHRPLLWLTTNTKPVPNVHTVKFDYYWNRTKIAYLDHQCFHKQRSIKNYQQYPIHTSVRSHKFLSYYSRNTEHHRATLRQHLQANAQGFIGSETHYLEPNCQVPTASPDPPARKYFDQSYISCLVETQCLNCNSILISEKTYDQLIQGRPVLNFATPGFYQQLAADGWQLPSDVDWSWDTMIDDSQRWTHYLAELDKLLSLNLDRLHQWFLDNMSCWQHNHEMLRTKPYDIIDTSCYW